MSAVISRRFFLGGLLAVGASAAITKALPVDTIPRIWADGIHDDTPGLQAALDGKPFVADDCVISDYNGITLSGGTFRLSGTVFLRNAELSGAPPTNLVTQCRFVGDENVNPMFDARDAKNTHISNSIFETKGNHAISIYSPMARRPIFTHNNIIFMT